MKYIQRTNNESTYHIDEVFGSTTSWTSIFSPLVPAAGILYVHGGGKQALSHSPCHMPSRDKSADTHLEHIWCVNEHTLDDWSARIVGNRSLAKVLKTSEIDSSGGE